MIIWTQALSSLSTMCPPFVKDEVFMTIYDFAYVIRATEHLESSWYRLCVFIGHNVGYHNDNLRCASLSLVKYSVAMYDFVYVSGATRN